MEIKTERLLMRHWRDEDLPLFAAINADTDVMEYYPNTLTLADSDSMADKLSTLLNERGWGFWAVEQTSDKSFIGFVGLHRPLYELPVTPCVEMGWRLAKKAWGKGYATEAASAALKYAFEQLDLIQVYSFTSVSNHRSRAVMERIKMKNTHENFDHPIIPVDHPLREHVLYKINQCDWRKK